jgi:hypothetical protein
MRTIRVLSTIFVALSVAAHAHAQQRADFSGHWRLDAGASRTMGGGRGDASGNASGGGGGAGGGIGLGAPATELTIRHDDSTVTVDERREDNSVVAIVYRLDGKKVTNSMLIGGGQTASATYSSRWKDSALVTTISRNINARGRVTSIGYTERRYLSSDGALVVETRMDGRPAGRKAVYKKADSTP